MKAKGSRALNVNHASALTDGSELLKMVEAGQKLPVLSNSTIGKFREHLTAEQLYRLGRGYARDHSDTEGRFFRAALERCPVEEARLLAEGVLELSLRFDVMVKHDQGLPAWFWQDARRIGNYIYTIFGASGGSATIAHCDGCIAFTIQGANGARARHRFNLHGNPTLLLNWVVAMAREGKELFGAGQSLHINYFEPETIAYEEETRCSDRRFIIERSISGEPSVAIGEKMSRLASIKLSAAGLCQVYAAIGGYLPEIMALLGTRKPDTLNPLELQALAWYHGSNPDVDIAILAAEQERRFRCLKEADVRAIEAAMAAICNRYDGTFNDIPF